MAQQWIATGGGPGFGPGVWIGAVIPSRRRFSIRARVIPVSDLSDFWYHITARLCA